MPSYYLPFPFVFVVCFLGLCICTTFRVENRCLLHGFYLNSQDVAAAPHLFNWQRALKGWVPQLCSERELEPDLFKHIYAHAPRGIAVWQELHHLWSVSVGRRNV
jgi:hypothetical protein